MKLWDQLKERRITQIMVAYLAGGWIAVTVVDTLVDRQTLPELAFRLALVAFVGGVFVTLILGWYHGEKGSQKVTIPEIAMLVLVTGGTVGSGVMVTSQHLADERAHSALAGSIGFDAQRVAVLYFEDATGSEELSWLADALTEDLIHDLAGIPTLNVVSRNGVAPFRGEPVAPEEVGRALNAGSVIDGSVETVRGDLRVNIQFLDGISGATIDRTAFTLPADQVLAVRDSVASLATGFLRSRLGEEIRARELRTAASTVEGWTLLQRAERLRKDGREAGRHDRDEARVLFERADSLLAVAEELEPRWADPPATRASLAISRAIVAPSLEARVGTIQEGIRHADRALERTPRHARALEARGDLRYYLWELNVSHSSSDREALLDQAIRDLQAATAADPNLASAHALLSSIHHERKDLMSAALSAREALRADAFLANAHTVLNGLFFAHYNLAQFTEARNACQDGARQFPRDPNFHNCRLWLMLAPVSEPDPELAWELSARADSLTPPQARPFQSALRRILVGGVLARAELPDSARAVLESARVGPDVDPDQDLVGLEALIQTMLGDQDEAVRLLRRYAVGNPDHMAGFLEVDGGLHWWWRPLRDHADFRSLLRPGG